VTVRWRKLGRVYCAAGEAPWAMSHAYCPTALGLDDGERIRVFCAFLDAERIGRCGWVDVATDRPDRVIAVSRRPALDVGVPGAFDEHGVTPLSVVRLEGGRLRLYYAGWQRGVGVRYFLFTGAAHSDDDGLTFQRVSQAPLLDRADGELHVRSSVLVQPRADEWRMWYAGGSGWVGDGRARKPRYALRVVDSRDGLAWPDVGRVCLEPESDELGFARPCVTHRDGTFRMWYSWRALAGDYQLGYAESPDGLCWRRLDDRAGLERGTAGEWDGEMIGLSCLLEAPDRDLLFYNGNGYGAAGFGVAVAEAA
jgi:hypothetical protein